MGAKNVLFKVSSEGESLSDRLSDLIDRLEDEIEDGGECIGDMMNDIRELSYDVSALEAEKAELESKLDEYKRKKKAAAKSALIEQEKFNISKTAELIKVDNRTIIPLSSIIEITGPFEVWADDDGEEYDEPGEGRTFERYAIVKYKVLDWVGDDPDVNVDVKSAYMSGELYDKLVERL